MVANLSAHKRGWDDRWAEFSAYAAQGQAQKDRLLRFVDADTQAFNAIMAAFGLPKGSDAEKITRKNAIEAATKHAIEVPFEVMQVALASFAVIGAMAKTGNPNSVTDAGVGALCARAAVHGAFLNVKINTGGLLDKAFVADILAQAEQLCAQADAFEQEIMAVVHSKM